MVAQRGNPGPAGKFREFIFLIAGVQTEYWEPVKKCCWVLHVQSRRGNISELIVQGLDGRGEEERHPWQRCRTEIEMCRMKRLWFVRISLKLMDQICSLVDTTIRHKAGDKGLPIGLPCSWRMHRCPSLKVCMFNAVVSSSGTSLMRILPVTFKRRNVRPLMKSPGLLLRPG